MKQISETGHAVNVDHFYQLKTVTSGFGPSYAPNNPAIQQDALETKYAASKAANDTVAAVTAIWKAKVTALQSFMKPLNKLVTRVTRALKACGASDGVIEQANEYARKIKGGRAEKLSEEEKAASKSASQTSAAQRISNFRKLLELLSTVPAYMPSAADVRLDALQALMAEMETANNGLIAAQVPLTNARNSRNEVLYADKTGMLDLAQLVKDEVAAFYGFGSPEHKQLTRLRFTNFM